MNNPNFKNFTMLNTSNNSLEYIIIQIYQAEYILFLSKKNNRKTKKIKFRK